MDERWIWACIAIAGGLAAGGLVGLLLRRLLDRPGRRDAVREVAAPLSLFAFWLLFATGLVIAIGSLSPSTLNTVPTDLLAWFPNLAIAGVLLIGGYALGLTLATAVGRVLGGVSGRPTRAAEAAVRSVIFAAAVVVALDQIGVDTTIVDILVAGIVFAAAATMVGVAIMGARSVAGDVASGRTLRRVVGVGTPIRAEGIDGVITDLQVAHVVLETTDGLLVVPYGRLMAEPFLIPDGGESAQG